MERREKQHDKQSANFSWMHGRENAAWEISKDEIVFSALLFLIFGKNIRNRSASWRLGVEKPSQQIFNHSEFWHIQRWGKKRTNLKHKKKNFKKMALQGFNHKKWITLHNSIVHLVTCTMSKKIEPHWTCFICDT